MTAFSLFIYTCFVKKNRFFYNYFRKPTKYTVTPYLKRGGACLFLCWTWMVGLSFIFEKRIPDILNDKHLFEKY